MTKVKSKLIAFLCAIVMVLGLTLTSLPTFRLPGLSITTICLGL